MSGKFLRVIFATILSVGLIGQVNAITIPYFVEGENYSDENGNLWEFVGAFDVGAGPQYIDVNNNGIEDIGDQFPTPLNGLQAAVSLGFGNSEDLAISAFEFDVGNGVIGADEFADQRAFAALFSVSIAEVNFTSWYDGFTSAMRLLSQDILADTNGNGKYTLGSDNSAYVKDRSDVGDYTNYVFKSVSVSAPFTFGIFALALCGVGACRLRG
jgi:hypothetical protein